MTDLSCVASKLCTAVSGGGYAVTFSAGHAQAPKDIDRHAYDMSISCTAETSCVAVDDEGHALVETAAGWGKLHKVDRLATYGLAWVSCVTGPYCWAVDGLGSGYLYD